MERHTLKSRIVTVTVHLLAGVLAAVLAAHSVVSCKKKDDPPPTNSGSTVTVSTPTFTLSAAQTGSGTGSVTSNPSGISCGSDCSEIYNSSTSVTLTASADSNSTFGGWSGGGCSGSGNCTTVVDSTKTVTASFYLKTFMLTVTIVNNSGATGTSVTSSPAGVSCPTNCSVSFNIGTSVILTEAGLTNCSPSNIQFSGWSGACTGSSCTVTMDGDKSVTATFFDNGC